MLKWWSSIISIFIQIWRPFKIRKYKILRTLSYCKQLWWFFTSKKNDEFFILFLKNREFMIEYYSFFINIFGNLVRICPWFNHLQSLHGNYFGWPHFEELFLLELFCLLDWNEESKEGRKGSILLKSQFSLRRRRRRLWGDFH